MIYIVDEDVGQLRPLECELRLRGHRVEILRNADLAFAALSSCKDAEIAIIDVMLAVKDGADGSRYGIEETDEGVTTGLCFLEDLAKFNEAFFPKHAAILTQASRPQVLAKIEAACKLHRIPFWRKITFQTVFDLADTIETQMKAIKG